MTEDFIQDAIDSLERDPECCYVLIAAHFGRPECITAARVTTREGVEWMQRRFADLRDKIMANIEENPTP